MQNIYDKIGRFMQGCVDMVLPPLCVVTGEVVDRQGMIAPEAWQILDFIAAPYCSRCGVAFDYEVEEGIECARCLEHPPSYDSARAALVYNDGSRSMILDFKHGDRTLNVLAFTPWLERAGQDMLEEADYIMPVPLHRWRLVARRYNQAALIAQALSVRCDVPTLIDGLRRVRATKPQGYMNFEKRRRNVKAAFSVDAHYLDKVKGTRIVLVDDVYTTGATVNECAKILRKAGAARVDVLTLARVMKEV